MIDRHDQHVKNITKRLCRKGYDLVMTLGEYWIDGEVRGECDIMTIRNGITTYYEIKTGKNHESRAEEQLNRFRDLHPNLSTRLVYINTSRKDRRVKRI